MGEDIDVIDSGRRGLRDSGRGGNGLLKMVLRLDRRQCWIVGSWERIKVKVA